MEEKINKIKEVLVRKSVSQKELAVQLEKNEHTVSNWCINKSQPHLKDLQKNCGVIRGGYLRSFDFK